VEFEIDGEKQTLTPGSETFIPAGVNHSVRNTGGKTARWYYGYKRKGRTAAKS
jgi:quercetin dioxygenase-like cupin family protein